MINLVACGLNLWGCERCCRVLICSINMVACHIHDIPLVLARYTLVVSSDNPDSPEQSLTTPDPSPNHSDLSLCIPEPSVVSPSPSSLSLISIWSNWPFLSPTTRPNPVWPHILPYWSQAFTQCFGQLPSAFPEATQLISSSDTISEALQAFPSHFNLCWPPWTHITLISYPDTPGFPCYVYSIYGSPTRACPMPFSIPDPCLAFPDLLQILFLRFDLYSLGFLSCLWLS